jgi:hypothetical protein
VNNGIFVSNLASSNNKSDLGRLEDAVAVQVRALEFERRVLPPNHPDIAGSLHHIKLSYAQAGNMTSAAMECAREALTIRQAALPPPHDVIVAAEKRSVSGATSSTTLT